MVEIPRTASAADPESKTASSNGGQKKKAARPAGVVEVIEAIANKTDPLVKLVTTFFERSLKAQEAKARHSVRMAMLAMIIVLVIVVTAAVLTYLGKLEGSTFGFLLGLIIGYVLTFVRDSVNPPKEPTL
jgi:uncharacterized membrane protein